MDYLKREKGRDVGTSVRSLKTLNDLSEETDLDPLLLVQCLKGP